ncbi:MAG TPA: GxxExxY protein [Caulobacteraceae bacterium]|nr:GxxExxY protein [Caulobacteraceae bacterium]
MEHEGHQGHEVHEGLNAELETLATVIVDAGLKVHRALGPGLLESVYEHCLVRELQLRSVRVDRQAPVRIIYEGMTLKKGFRLDLLVESKVVVEVKAIDAFSRVHEAQLATYLRLSELRLGFLMNFNVSLFKQGLKRIVL